MYFYIDHILINHILWSDFFHIPWHVSILFYLKDCNKFCTPNQIFHHWCICIDFYTFYFDSKIRNCEQVNMFCILLSYITYKSSSSHSAVSFIWIRNGSAILCYKDVQICYLYTLCKINEDCNRKFWLTRCYSSSLCSFVWNVNKNIQLPFFATQNSIYL